MNRVVKLNNLQSSVVAKASNRRIAATGNTIVYALIYIVLAAAVSYLLNVAIIPGGIVLNNILIPATAYLLLGLSFAFFLYPKLNYLSEPSLNSGFLYSAIVFACIFSVTLLTGMLKGNISIISALFYSCLFLLPFTIYQTWLLYKNISVASYAYVWHLPEPTGKVPAATIFLNSVRIKIKVAPVYGTQEEVYETTVPGRMSVGKLFTNFVHYEVNKQAEEIETKDESSHFYGWQFFTSNLMGLNTRPLNPDLNLYENGIKDKSIIIARRVQNQLQLT